MNKKYLKSLLSFILTIGLIAPAVVLGNSTTVFGGESGSDSEESVTISFENGIHSVADPADGNRKMVVYCMNNQMLWPHDTDSLGDVSVPKYLNGYLKASDFESEEKYEECMDRLESVLYAGYPYNGESMYEIVADSKDYVPTDAQFDAMLVPSADVLKAFPELKGHTFTLASLKDKSGANYKALVEFNREVINMVSSGTAAEKETGKAIQQKPFYKAANSVVMCSDYGYTAPEYSLQIPTGMTLEKKDKSTEATIRNGEEFRLVSDEKPSENASIIASATVQWLQEMKQYRPAQEVTVNGKKFQRMIGAMVETESLQATLSYSVKEEEKVPPTDPTDPAGPTDPTNPGTTENPGDSADKNNPENPSNPADTENTGSKDSNKTTGAKETTIATGDDFNPVLYGGVALLAIAGLIGIVRYRKKN